MKKIKKILIIIMVLLAPIFVFLFLKEFGSNEFVLPIYYADGNPIKKCNASVKQHQLSKELIFVNNWDYPPLLFYVPGTTANNLQPDLDNVLEKYPKIGLESLELRRDINHMSRGNHGVLDSLAFFNFINCELILGEDHLVTDAITNKFVLVDKERVIRGYYQVDNLDEIERLDVELDILLNY